MFLYNFEEMLSKISFDPSRLVLMWQAWRIFVIQNFLCKHIKTFEILIKGKKILIFHSLQDITVLNMLGKFCFRILNKI